MTIRTTSKTITFNRPFFLKGVYRLLPAGDYRVVTDEELIEGLSFPAYHRISTVIFVPAQSGSAVEMVTIEPSGPSGGAGKRWAVRRACQPCSLSSGLQNYSWHLTAPPELAMGPTLAANFEARCGCCRSHQLPRAMQSKERTDRRLGGARHPVLSLRATIPSQ